MQSKVFKLLAITMIMIFIFGYVSGVAAAGQPQKNYSNGQANITTSQAAISVNGNGNLPFFHIKLNNQNTTYEVKLVSAQEWVNNKAVPSSGISMPSLGWTFSNFNTVNDSSNNIQSINFNFTSSAKKSGPLIQLDNHVNIANGNQIKFDLIVNNYVWTSHNTSAQFAVKFQIAGGNLTQGSGSNSNNLSFGNAQFNSVSTASTPNGNINVATQLASKNSFYLIYNHFNGNFTHDPTFSAVVSSNTASTTKGLGLELLPVISGFAVIGIVIAKKRHS